MKNLSKLINAHFQQNMAGLELFVVALTGRQVWDTYINGFDKAPIFRDPQASFYECNNCTNFIKRYGNIVALNPDTLELISLFDVELTDDISEYHSSLTLMSQMVKGSPIKDIFRESYENLYALPYEKTTRNLKKFRLGFEKNVKVYSQLEIDAYPGTVEPEKAYSFFHFYLDLPVEYVILGKESVAKIKSNFKSDFEVFKRAMDEITTDTFELVIDLINQKSILKAEPHLQKVIAMRDLSKLYEDVKKKDRFNWAFLKSISIPFAKFKNELIGVFCSDLAEGMDLVKACKKWNKASDPTNYMKATAPITKTQIKKATEKVILLGYQDSFERTFATLKDIAVPEILHINNGSGVIEEVTIFDQLEPTKKSSHSRNEFDKVQSVSIDTFMKDILPNATSIEAYLDNHHTNNMVTLTTAKNKSEKSMFNYGNNYSQTFNGNIAGKSAMAIAVESKGGRLDVPFRFSNSWNHPGKRNDSLMDFHVCMPGCPLPSLVKHGQGTPPETHRIGWNARNHNYTGGSQDVDFVDAAPINKVPVENIILPDLSKLREGDYNFYAHNWRNRTTANGFKSEIHLIGHEVYEYDFTNVLEKFQWIRIATATLKNGVFTIVHHLEPVNGSKKLYGLDTKKFHPVNLVCTSPNHWGDSNKGHKHYLFILDKCKVQEPIRSFHAVDLVPELQEIRKVLEPLGYKTMLDSSIPEYNKQLSGIGFDATESSEVILKVKGTHSRVLKVIF